MFTDWTMIDPRYFYLRGAIWGLVCATFFWKLFIPWMQSKLINLRKRR